MPARSLPSSVSAPSSPCPWGSTPTASSGPCRATSARPGRGRSAAATALVVFPLLDLLLMSIVTRLLLFSRDRPAAYNLLLVGLFSLGVAHTARVASILGFGPSSAGMGALCIVGYGLWGSAALHP